MNVIVASDIHGVSAGLRSMLGHLSDNIRYLSPWTEVSCPYPSEEEAVHAFHAQNGIERYAQKIAEAANGEAVLLIGFSVGASSAWLYAADPACHPRTKAFLYYGSRIREHLSLAPRCDVSLIFAEHERSFNPRELMPRLTRERIRCTLVPGTAHGFFNPASRNFSEVHASEQLTALKQTYMQCR